jgi:hypothetical protein
MFLALAASCPDRERARKWEALAALEHETAGRIAKVLGAGQAPLPSGVDGNDEGEARIAGLSGRRWDEQMTWLKDIAADALESMSREAALFPSEMRQLVEFVLAHERALVEFATRELAGSDNDSLRAVHRLFWRHG